MKLRWLLPFGHALVDILLLSILTMHLTARLQSLQTHQPRRPVVRFAMFLQEDAAITFDPKTLPPPAEFLLVVTGNPVAGFVSTTARPEAGVLSPRRSWDPIWFLIHEAVSIPCWYLLGAWVDGRRPRLGVVMISYLFIRFTIAVAGQYEVGWRIQVLFWLGITMYLLVFGSIRLGQTAWRATKRA